MSILRRELISAVLVSIFAFYSQTVFMAYLGIHLNSLAASAFTIGMIFGLRNIIQIFFRIPLGEFSQIIGRKPLILTGMAFFTLSYVFMYLATDWKLVAVATLSLAIGMSFYYPALFAYIGDISEDNYGKINGIIFQGSDVAIVFGLFGVKVLLERHVVDLPGVFLLSFAISFFGTVLGLILLPEVLETHDQLQVISKFQSLKDSMYRSRSSFFQLSKDPKLRTVYLYQFVISFGEFFVQSFVPLLVVLSLGYAESDVAEMWAFSTIAVFFVKPFLGSISDRFGFQRPVIFALLVNSLMLILFTYAFQFYMIVIIFGILVANIMMSYLGVNGATSYNADAKNRGTAMGVLGVWVSIGRSLSSFILGPAWQILENITGDEGYSLKIVFRITGGMLAIGAIILYRMNKNLVLIKETLDDLTSTESIVPNSVFGK